MDPTEMIDIYKPTKGSGLELTPCPFCGSTEVVYMSYNHAAGKRWAAVCMGCIAMVDPGWAQQRHQVQDLWNRRATSAE